ncbi:MAG: SEC59/DGK1/VTE5 family protein [Treponema sp.]|nr:SEC59/DGK1/VTE5 family protein [Treponema sp.]
MARKGLSKKYPCEKDGIIRRQRLNDIAKELFRKSIHVCSAFIPLFLQFMRLPVLFALTAALVLYSIAEFMRLKGKSIPVVSTITAAAARKRDENRFVLGPVTLCAGIILAAILFEPFAASIGIYALAFGDGLASLAGKLFGKVKIPLTQGKTVAGSLTCFAAIFVSCFLVCFNAKIALCVASAGMFIELLPLKDLDNLFIPLVLGMVAQSLY